MKRQQIYLFDTTLRDGQQCPGAGMSFEHNIEYAHLVGKAGLDVLEAGFASASQLDFKIVNTIATELPAAGYSTTIASLCQLREAQIDRTIEALLPAKGQARLHTYLPVDPELMQASLGKYAEDKKQLINNVHDFIKKATDAGLEVEFSPEGYSRQRDNFDFTTDALRAAIQAGATIMNCPDTIGGGCYLQGDDYFVKAMQKHADMMRQEFPDKNVCWSAHCHNDFGLAVANSINAVFDGPVTQIEGCFNGLGERAGNAALEQCIMIIRQFGKQQEIEYFTNFNTEHLKAISDFIATHMLPRQPHWPVTGENAAKHTSGGHTNAIINNPLAYQPFDPKAVGSEVSFIFGPMSGGNHAQTIIREHGYLCDDSEKAPIAQYIKDIHVERRKGITDAELVETYLDYRKPIKANNFNYTRENSHTTLQLVGDFFDKQDQFDITYDGDDSALAALHQAVKDHMPTVEIESYNSEGVGKGIDALSRSTIVILSNDKVFTGIAEDADIGISALKAFISAVNQAYIAENFMGNK